MHDKWLTLASLTTGIIGMAYLFSLSKYAISYKKNIKNQPLKQGYLSPE
jgi:hypothetical protein